MKTREGGSEEILASRALFPFNKRKGEGWGQAPRVPPSDPPLTVFWEVL